MFLRRVEEARTIYFAYYSKMASGEGVVEKIITDDFAELRKAGRENRLTSEVEAKFSDALWNQQQKKHMAMPVPVGSSITPEPVSTRPRATEVLPRPVAIAAA